jgi:hypothetical protein
MKALAVPLLALTALLFGPGPRAAAEPPVDRHPTGTSATPLPQAKGKPAPRPVKRKRTKTTIPPAKGKTG